METADRRADARVEQAERRCRAIGEDRRKLQAQADVLREDAERNARRAERAEQELAEARRRSVTLFEQVQRLQRSADRREPALGLATNADLAAELTARYRIGHDHPAYRTVGDGPTSAAEAGLRPITVAHPDAEPTAVGEGVYQTSELLEATSGLFVPIPTGHMLSVTVTPYDDREEPELGKDKDG